VARSIQVTGSDKLIARLKQLKLESIGVCGVKAMIRFNDAKTKDYDRTCESATHVKRFPREL